VLASKSQLNFLSAIFECKYKQPCALHIMKIQSSEYLAAINAAFEAGKAVMTIYATNFTTDLKEDGSPITQADRMANEIICNALASTGFPIISEESPKDHFQLRKEHDFVWLVDPVDGTREFTKRNGEFTINIALIYKGHPVFGIVTAPAHDQAWIGWVRQRAWKLDFISSIEHKLPFTGVSSFLNHCKQINPRKKAEKPVVVLSLSHLTQNTLDMLHYLLGEPDEYEVKRTGSSLKFCLVAEGKADFYLRADAINEWDTAAGQAVLEAAGGEIVTWPNGGQMLYNQQNLLNPGFTAFGDPSFSDILEGKLPFQKRI
jgi:3'(2'), 5'-bisphosphate nucleotidase